jgi:hypothetical protein
LLIPVDVEDIPVVVFMELAVVIDEPVEAFVVDVVLSSPPSPPDPPLPALSPHATSASGANNIT